MENERLKGLFDDYLDKKTIFLNKKVLQPNYNPEEIPHRDNEIEQIAKTLAPALKSDKPSNIFLYGKTGTGKTLTVKYITKILSEKAKQKKIQLEIVYINCKLKRVADTEYRLIAQIAREFGKAIPPTGLPTDEVYKSFYAGLDTTKKIVILVLDEIDQLIKKAGDSILYNLTRINEELKNSQLSLVGISNDLMFAEDLDPRVKSSLSEEEIVFPPYNALQIQDILKQRAKKGFIQGAVEQGVIAKCAAYAAREHGDARRAIDLLRVAGELAERNKEEKLSLKYIDEAEKKIENDRIFDLIKTQPKQFQATLYSMLSIKQDNKNHIFTGEIYDLYKKICFKASLNPLTQRRVSDILAEFDMLGLINAKIISKGRYGRTRQISISIPHSIIPLIRKILEEELCITRAI